MRIIRLAVFSAVFLMFLGVIWSGELRTTAVETAGGVGADKAERGAAIEVATDLEPAGSGVQSPSDAVR